MNFRVRLYLESCTLSLFILEFKFISNSLNGSNTINTQFLADLTDMHINSTVAYNDIIAPYLVEDFVAEKNPPRFLRQEVQ